MPKRKTVREKIEGLPNADREILDQIGAGEESGHAWDACKRLERLGLIAMLGMKTINQDRFGPVQIPAWEMPISAHIEWCQICKEEIERGGDEEIALLLEERFR
jgi:hypothetical protein